MADPESTDQAGPRATSFRWVRRGVACVLCCAVAAAGAYARFDGIVQQGMDEGDNVTYHNIGKHWLEGRTDDFWQDLFYRPVVYALNAAAISLFGDTDYALKAFNGIADTINIVLILGIGWQVSRSIVPGLAAALAYAVAAYVITMCRSGMPHTLSTFFVLAAVFFFHPRPSVSLVSWKRLLSDYEAGILLGLATHTHGELAALGFGFVACQAVQSVYEGWSLRAFGRFIGRAAMLTGGFLFVFWMGIVLFGWEKVKTVLSNEINAAAFAPEYVESTAFYTIPYRALAITSEYGWLWAYWLPILFLIPPASWAVRRALKKSGGSYCNWIPWALVLSNMLGFTFVIGGFDTTHPRVFLPVVPLLFIAAFGSLYAVAQLLPRPGRLVPVAGMAAALFWETPNFFPKEDFYANPKWYARSVARSTHELIGAKVDDQHRLLILPSTAYVNRAFQMTMYFGSNAVFLRELERTDPYTGATLARIHRENHFAYVYMSNHLDFRFLDPAWQLSAGPQAWLQGPAYDVRTEDMAIAEFMVLERLHLLAQGKFGMVFSSNKRPLFPNSQFERGTLENWGAQGFVPMFALAQDAAAPSPNFVDTQNVSRYPERMRDGSDPNSIGLLASAPFVIEADRIGFAIGGQGDPQQVHVALAVAGTEMRAAPSSAGMTLGEWDVSAYQGQQAQIVIRDLAPRPAQGIKTDGFYYIQ